jgi:hypothetical protein
MTSSDVCQKAKTIALLVVCLPWPLEHKPYPHTDLSMCTQKNMYYRIEWTWYCVGTPDMAPTLGGYNSSRRAGVVTHADLRENYNPGNKYSQWELKGMCVRLELGPKDMQKESVMSVRRDSGAKEAIPWNELTMRMPEILEEMQEAMYKRAKEKVSASMATVSFPSLIFVFAGGEVRWHATEPCIFTSQ